MACSDSLHKTDLFKKKGGFRIPALLHIPDSNILLAFAESRHGPKDESADVLYHQCGKYNQSSKDFQEAASFLSALDLEAAGTTILRKKSQLFPWNHATPMKSAKLQKYRSMNPCPVYDKEKKTVFLFFIAVDGKTEQEQIKSGKNAAHLCYVTSGNNGQTWGDTVHLTDKCNGPKAKPCTDDTINTWATFALGPGHGIQLKNGRLVIPANAHVKESNNTTRVRAFTFFSDDHGDSLQIGEFISGEECGECQVVSLDQGNKSSGPALIYCNARNNNSCKNHRVEAFSHDGGEKFKVEELVTQLVECPGGCHGSIISFPASDISNVRNYPDLVTYHTQKGGDASNFDIILFSHITNSKSRRDLGIYLCTYSGDAHTQTNSYSDGLRTWTNPWVFFPHKSAYSELAFVKLPEERNPIVTCLFEYGKNTDMISFCVLQIDDIIEKTVKSKKCCGNPEAGKCAISRCFCCCCC